MDPFGYKTAKFIKRLYKVVNDDSIPQIRWNNNGRSFIIPSKDEFLKKVLPHISKTKEYSAFVRLLNHYGFQKIQGFSPDSEEYFHKNFIKDDESNLIYITRTKQRKLAPNEELVLYKRENEAMREQLNYLLKSNLSINSEISLLKNIIEKQDKTITGLIEVLSKVFNMGIKTQKQMAIKGDYTVEENLSTILKEKEAIDLEPQNKRILADLELKKSLDNVDRNNKFMLMENTKKEEEEEEEDTLNFADFF